MNAFEDLIPRKSSGGDNAFADLIPAKASWGEVIKKVPAGAGHSFLTGAAGTFRAIADIAGADAAAEYWADVFKGGQETIRESTPRMDKGSLKSSVYGGLQSTVMNILPILGAVVTKNPAVALAPMGLTAFGQEYGEMRGKGKGVGESLLAGGGIGAAEIVTEMIPLGSLMKMKVFKFILQDLFGENVNTVLQEAIRAGNYKPEMKFGEFLKTLPPSLWETTKQTAMAAPLTGGIVGGINRAIGGKTQAKPVDLSVFEEEVIAETPQANAFADLIPEQSEPKVEEIPPTIQGIGSYPTIELLKEQANALTEERRFAERQLPMLSEVRDQALYNRLFELGQKPKFLWTAEDKVFLDSVQNVRPDISEAINKNSDIILASALGSRKISPSPQPPQVEIGKAESPTAAAPNQKPNIVKFLTERGGIDYTKEKGGGYTGELDRLKEMGLTRPEFNTLVRKKKTENAKSLDDALTMARDEGYLPESATLDDLIDAIANKKKHPEVLEQEAIKLMESRQNKPAVFPEAYPEGTKFIIDGEEFKVVGRNKAGGVILEDGEIISLEAFDSITPDKIILPEEEFLKSQSIQEKPKKATQADMFGAKQGLEGKMPSKEVEGGLPLEQARIEEIQRQEVKKQMPLESEVKNDKTGEVQVQELGDLKPIKNKNILQSEEGAIDFGKIIKSFKERPDPEKVKSVYSYLSEKKITPTDEQLKKSGLNSNEMDEVKRLLGIGDPDIVTEALIKGKTIPQKIASEAVNATDKTLGIISTRLKNIHPSLKKAIRRHSYDSLVNTGKDENAVFNWVKKYTKLDESVKNDLDKSLANGDKKTSFAIMKQHGLLSEFTNAIKTIHGIKGRAQAAGFDIGTIENYFPRVVAHPQEYLTYLRGKEYSAIDEAINKIEKTQGKLTVEEKAEIADKLLRGFPVDRVFLKEPYTDPTHRAQRKIAELDDEKMQFYQPSDKALLSYIKTMNGAIENAKFFGKHKDKKQLMLESAKQESIGDYVIELKNKGLIKPEQEHELRGILQAYFSPGRIGDIGRLYKGITHATLLGQLTSTVTQLGDFALIAYKNGLLQTGKVLPKAIKQQVSRTRFGNDKGGTEVSVEDLKLRSAIEELEQTGLANIVDKIFTVTGFNAINRIGQDTALQGGLNRMRILARKNDPALIKEITEYLDAESVPKTITDLKEGKVTDDIKFLLFNRLADIQPITKSEVPQKYLEMKNGKIFYSLKTYQLKLLDIYRNDVYNEIKSGNVKGGLKNLGKLTVLLVALNAGADEIKDFMLGRKTDFSDKVIDNLLRLTGLSKYHMWKMREEGAYGTLIRLLAPPANVLSESIPKDIGTIIKKGGDVGHEDLTSPKDVPIVGKQYYWWFGKGRVQAEKRGEAIYLDELTEVN